MQYKLHPLVLLLILTGLNLFNYFDRFILASLLESVKSHYLLTDAQAGALSTAFMIGYFITSPIFGYLGDRFSRKGLISFGVAIWSFATIMTGQASSFYELIFYRVLVGLGEASYATLSPGLIADIYKSEKRNTALTIFYVAIPLGAACGTLFGSWFGTHYGWQNAFFWAGAPGLILAFILTPFAEPMRGESETQSNNADKIPPKILDIFKFNRLRDFKLVIFGYIAYAFALGAYQYWAQAFLQRVHGMPQIEAGNFVGLTAFSAGLIGTFVGGFLATRVNRKFNGGYAFVIGTGVTLALPFAYLFTYSESLIITKIGLAIAMCFLFFPTGPVNTIILESVPLSMRSSAMAISIFFIHAFGDLWSPTLVGKISDDSLNLRSGIAILLPALMICAFSWLYLAYLQKNKPHAMMNTRS